MKVCIICKKEFEGLYNQKTCSLECRNNFNINKRKKWGEDNKDKVRKNSRNSYYKNIKKRKERLEDYRKKYPNKIKAHRKAKNIEINKKCEVCKNEKAVIRHHPDYFKPLSIQLVCRSCHAKIHSWWNKYNKQLEKKE